MIIIVSVWAFLFVIMYLLNRYPNKKMSKLALTWFGPKPKIGESFSSFQFRWAFYSFFLLIFFTAACLLNVFLLEHVNKSSRFEVCLLIFNFFIVIGFGMALLAFLGFIIKAMKAKYFGPNPTWGNYPFNIHNNRRNKLEFSKYHALGNVYIVVNPEHTEFELSTAIIKNICHKNYGVSSDGLLIGPLESTVADFALQIFNPDGSEAEKSGNGLRIFCRYLWDLGLVDEAPFSVETKGGVVRAQVFENGNIVRVEMGRVSFSSSEIPVLGAEREVLLEDIDANGCSFKFSALTIGNPHCVILVDEPTEEIARSFGSIIENHPNFLNRTNVQFLKVIDRNNIKIEIWERGAGYTLASGSSSCAAASVARKLGLCESNIKVLMPGGEIDIEISESFTITMQGAVTPVCVGEIYPECLSQHI